ncbi:MAG: GNAT family N-acetyltransferase [Nanoarchaeota archaeon]
MIIRKASTSDFTQLKALKEEFFLWECQKDPYLDPRWARRGLGSRLARNLKQKNGAFFVAETGGKLIGYAGVAVEDNPASFRARKKGHIFNLYVLEAFRRKGVAKLLFQKAVAWLKAQKVGEHMIMVYDENELAHRWYNRLGYKDTIIILKK